MINGTARQPFRSAWSQRVAPRGGIHRDSSDWRGLQPYVLLTLVMKVFFSHRLRFMSSLVSRSDADKSIPPRG